MLEYVKGYLGLNCVSSLQNDDVVLNLSNCECDLIWK